MKRGSEIAPPRRGGRRENRTKKGTSNKSSANSVLLCSKVFSASANFLVRRSQIGEVTRKYGLTTKRTKDTKGSDIYTLKLRALRDLRGEMSVRTLVAA